MKRLSGAQIIGAILLMVLGLVSTARFITAVADGYVKALFENGVEASSFFLFFALPLVAETLSVAGMLVAIGALVSRSRVLAVAAAGMAFCVSGLIIASEISGFTYLGQVGWSLRDRFTSISSIAWPSGWSYAYSSLGLATVAGSLLLIRARGEAGSETAHGSVSSPPAKAPLQPHATTTPPISFFIEVDGTEYGPFSAEHIREFIDEGRIIRSTLIRPSTGSYAEAGSVPGLFAR